MERMFEKHNSLCKADIVLSMLQNDKTNMDLDKYIENFISAVYVFDNYIEQGYTIHIMNVKKDMFTFPHLYISFSEQRSSDKLVVYVYHTHHAEKYTPWDDDTETWKNGHRCSSYEDAVSYIKQAVTSYLKMFDNIVFPCVMFGGNFIMGDILKKIDYAIELSKKEQKEVVVYIHDSDKFRYGKKFTILPNAPLGAHEYLENLGVSY